MSYDGISGRIPISCNEYTKNNIFREYCNPNTGESENSQESNEPGDPTLPPGEEQQQTATDPIKEYGVPAMPPPMPKNPRGNIQFLTIIGQVEGHMVLTPNNKTTKYEHVIPQLVLSAENPEVDGVLILLNTVGGDVEAGLAISELISNLGKPTVSLVIGGGHSIGVPLAVSANYSFIAPSATMTIHPVRLNGTVVSAPQTYDYFNKMQERIVEFITRNCGMTKERIRRLMLETNQLMMDVGTILIGQEAVDEKLIDSTGGLHDAMEKLYDMIAERRSKENFPGNENPGTSSKH